MLKVLGNKKRACRRADGASYAQEGAKAENEDASEEKAKSRWMPPSRDGGVSSTAWLFVVQTQ